MDPYHEAFEVLRDRLECATDQMIDRAVDCFEAADDAREQGHDAEWLEGRSEAHQEDAEAVMEAIREATDRLEHPSTGRAQWIGAEDD